MVMQKTNPPLILVDGSSYLFRAYHAMPNLMNSEGALTGAIYGVVNMVKKLLSDYQPTHMAVVFDAKGGTFRNEIYSEYKANRPPMPDDLRQQIEPVHNIIAAMGIPLYVIEGVEADDVLGTLARQASAKKVETLISTGDKDLAQLVDEHVQLIDTMKNVKLDPNGVIDKFGVAPEYIIDLLALMGDKSDNIPGVPGVGEKTALGLVTGLGGIESIYQHLDDVKGLSIRGAKSLAKKLADNEELAKLSYELATIKCDVPLDFTLDDLDIKSPDYEALAAYFQQFEFRTWFNELQKSDDTPIAAAPQQNYQKLINKNDFESLLKAIEKAELVAIDTETTSLNYMNADLVGIAISLSPEQSYYIPLRHDYEGAPEQLPREWVLEKLKPLLESDQAKFVGQNLKYDSHIFANVGIQLKAIAFDTMLESYIHNSVGSRHDMDSLAKKYLGRETVKFEDIAGKGKKQLTFNQIDVDVATRYAAEDADITLALHQHLWPLVQEFEGTQKVFSEIEMPLLHVLNSMERNGVLVDGEKLAAQSAEIAKKLKQLEEQSYELAGDTFNLGSPKQLQEVLFDKLELPILKKTPKGQPSTAEEVLVELAVDYELPALILEHRGLSKLKSTYTDKLPDQINARTGRIHTSYHQAVAATGRLSSSDPNLQNIPIKTEQGRKVRDAFIAPKGRCLIAADYSQIELRIMAHLSQDKGLLDAFAAGEDIHAATAGEIFDTDDVSSEQRRAAKAVNFGLIYGMSAFGLGRQLGIDRNEAQHYINTYFARYPGVEEYMNRTREFAHEHGFVETLWGRRLYLPEIRSSNGMRRKAAERAAINAPMQGSAADIIKLAMLKLDTWLEGKDDILMIMQVHDELVFEAANSKAEEYAKAISDQMMNAASLDVPLLVSAGIGQNWQEAH